MESVKATHMSDAMKAALKVLQQVIIKEHPNATDAVIHYSEGNWVDIKITLCGGGVCEC